MEVVLRLWWYTDIEAQWVNGKVRCCSRQFPARRHQAVSSAASISLTCRTSRLPSTQTSRTLNRPPIISGLHLESEHVKEGICVLSRPIRRLRNDAIGTRSIASSSFLREVERIAVLTLVLLSVLRSGQAKRHAEDVKDYCLCTYSSVQQLVPPLPAPPIALFLRLRPALARHWSRIRAASEIARLTILNRSRLAFQELP